ncbi:hypothetical protein CGH90_06480 [Vibrio parahaemolyticus]|nr:hypothetical protein HB39_15605 [Vibrio parahaemolyticus]TOL83081.1 hypothetical protein CGH90_06480 [Vibrio parahaemolyticus]
MIMKNSENKNVFTVNKRSRKSLQFIPKWFLISNYDVLKDITLSQYINELTIRLETLSFVKATLPENFGNLGEYYWDDIKEGRILTASQDRFETESVIAIKNTDLPWLSDASNLNKKRHDFTPPILSSENKTLSSKAEINSHLSDLDTFWHRESYLCSLQSGKKQVLLSIDLENSNNQIVLKQVEYVINSMRDALNFPEKKDTDQKNSNADTTKSFLKYKAIPYLDLLIYAHSHDFLDSQPLPLEFSASVLSDLLFCNDDKNGDFKFINTTVKEFYSKKLLDEDFMTKFISNVRKDKIFSQKKMSDIE